MTQRGDEGMTLVEILVAVAILGVAVTAILTGMMTSLLTSDIHRKQATAETIMRGYAEAARQAATSGYSSCATTYTIPFAPPAGYTVTLQGVDYRTAGGGWAAQPSLTCLVSDTVQRLRLTAVSADGRTQEAVQIVVRKP